jgi:hypothetical protein
MAEAKLSDLKAFLAKRMRATIMGSEDGSKQKCVQCKECSFHFTSLRFGFTSSRFTSLRFTCLRFNSLINLLVKQVR